MLTKIWTGSLLFLAWLAFCAWLVLVCREKNIHPLRDFGRFFKKQSNVGRVLFGTFFIAMWIYASVKPGDISPERSEHCEAMSLEGCGATFNLSGFEPMTSTNTTRTIEAEDFERGFVLTRIGTDEDFDFAPPSNATIVNDWLAFGAATDWIYAAFTNWTFKVATNDVSRLRIYSFGKVEPMIREVNGAIATNNWFAPFIASLGIVPQANWHLLGNGGPGTGNGVESQVWYAITPEGSLLITWQNALLDRDTDKPISFQIEFNPDGQFIYRYDLSRLDVDSVTNILAGASFGGNAWTTNSLPTNVTSMAFYPLSQNDACDQDPDNDGLATIDEFFVYHTDPHLRDTDFDGLTDYEELFIYNTNPLNPHSISETYCDGFAVKLGGLDPFACPEGSTHTIYEHIVYTGTTNAPFAYPVDADDTAVLTITASGGGAGRIVIGEIVVPVMARAASSSPRSFDADALDPTASSVRVPLPKGVKFNIWGAIPETLQIEIDSASYTIGRLPAWYTLERGWIAFPNTKAQEPCIHDLNAKQIAVTLDPGPEIEGLGCTWQSTSDIEAENIPPLSAQLTGNFPRHSTTPATYSLAHSRYLFGPTEYAQTARFCPRLSEPEDNTLHGDGMPANKEYGDGHDCSCSFGVCCSNEWCDCGHSCCAAVRDEGPVNRCAEHNRPYDQCEELHYTAYTNAMAMASMAEVLKLDRDPVHAITIPIDVPDGWVKCCGCPDHWTNYVALAAKSYNLAVRTAGGERFERTIEDGSISVHALAPSRDFKDSVLSLCKTGTVYETHNYTVLGLKIDHPYFNLKKLNHANREFGFPVVIGTNRIYGADFRLRTDVDLPSGNVHLGLEGAAPGFKLYLGSPLYGLSIDGTQTDEPLLLADSTTGKSFDVSIAQWKKIAAQQTSGREISVTLTAAQEGAADIVFGFAATNGGKRVSDLVRQRVTAIESPLKADCNHNGRIDDEDIELIRQGNPFRFWINEDIVRGDQAFGNHNEIVNSADLVVNGKWDLVNLFPIAIDLSSLTNAWQTGNIDFRIGGDSWGSSLNVTFANVAWTDLREIQTNVVVTSYGDKLYEAELQSLANGDVALPETILVGAGEDSGVLIAESRWWDSDSVALKAYMDGVEVCRWRLPIFTTSVQYMYRWINDRNANVASRLTSLGVPYNPSYVAADAKNLIVLHGANVSPEGAEMWGDYIFKRFWHSGFRGNYYFVSWTSDLGMTGANYQENVSNAFVTASSIAETIKAIPGDKVLMAHSLGNMVVSAMIEDHGLVPSAYIMCNSAVPIEAFDPEIDGTNVLVHEEWVDYPTNTWAKSWYTLFPEADSRSKLTWRGRFPSVAQYAFNFYSAGDHCLELFHNNHPGPFDYEGDDSQRFEQYCWHKQDIWKGRAGLTEGLGGTSWSGWGFAKNALGLRKFSVAEAQTMSTTPEVLTTNTVFRINPESMNTNVIERLVLDAHLAQGIPAWAPATGAVGYSETFDEKSFDLNSTDTDSNGIARPNGWPSFSLWGTRWLHSDMKDRAYFYVFKFYEKVIEVGDLK